MKIAYIAAGAAGMYCGSCIRDNALAQALMERGHDVALIPTYTPLRTDEPGVSIDTIFYNGISVFLEQKFRWMRAGVPLLDRLFNSSRVLGYLARANASTDAHNLGALTVSMLQGEHGNQHHELDKLTDWLKNEYRPDIIQLTNSMLAGMARRLRAEVQVPVLCALQGEDIFLDDLTGPWREQAMRELRRRVRDCNGLVATSEFYAGYMADYLEVEPESIHTVKVGINLAGHGGTPVVKDTPALTIGYLARICPEKGLHLLVEAFDLVRAMPGMEQVRLKAAGYLGARDAAYFENVKKDVSARGLSEWVEFVGEVDRQQKITFLSSLDVFSVPTPYQEPKGLSILEAMANHIPVVQPAHGSFPEIVAATGGGILVEPNDARSLADGLFALLQNSDRRRDMGLAGRAGVERHYTAAAMAEASEELFQRFL